ncbi:MAG: radical SAM family heme chaperone HemW [Lachnospiraceae bacterium]|nr:radical SAM family heme chaperone HemW [Lachnospiraceae bacterium]
MRNLELYVHIPFCIRKCLYCDFLSASAEASVRHVYINRLIDEIRTYAPDYRDCLVSSIYIGGGTPSILEPVQIEGLMEALCGNFRVAEDAEISIECNPGTLTGEKAASMRRSGINRISFGLQSADDAELRTLGRIHTFADFLRSFFSAREAGFTNINVDLMCALPGQSVKSWERTLRQTADLCPEHISAYSLILEEGTPFFEQFREDGLARERGDMPAFLPPEEEERRMYDLTGEYLRERGYRRYEISNYALPGYECRHNIGYWTDKEYLGLGLGASSLIENVRFRNTDVLAEYLSPRGYADSGRTGSYTGLYAGREEKERNHADGSKHTPVSELYAGREEKEQTRTDVFPPRREEERRGRKEEMEEFMFLGLRMTRGISRAEFRERFGVMPEEVYGNVLKGLKNEGLLDISGGQIFLTRKGVDVSNMVFMKFLL